MLLDVEDRGFPFLGDFGGSFVLVSTLSSVDRRAVGLWWRDVPHPHLSAISSGGSHYDSEILFLCS